MEPNLSGAIPPAKKLGGPEKAADILFALGKNKHRAY